MKKFLLIYIILMLCLISSVSSISLDIPLSPVLVEGENYEITLNLMSEEAFPGAMYFYYSNINSPTTIIAFDENSFSGNGPYTFQDSLVLTSGNVGEYSLKAQIIHANGTKLFTKNLVGIINSSAPIIISKSPSGVITNAATTLVVKTNEDAICKYGTTNTSYDNLSAVFTLTGERTHSQIIGNLAESSYTYYVRCKDFKGYIMKDSVAIDFIVDLPPSAEIEIRPNKPRQAINIEMKEKYLKIIPIRISEKYCLFKESS